jgi:hypothetical protein
MRWANHRRLRDSFDLIDKLSHYVGESIDVLLKLGNRIELVALPLPVGAIVFNVRNPASFLYCL